MMAGLQYYDISIAPNATRVLSAEGSYIRYHIGAAGGADETILVKADTGGLAAMLRPGQSIKLPAKVKDWRISNYANAGTIAGILIVGDGEIQDSQVAGTVQVIDGGKARTLAGSAFMFSQGATGAAGINPCAILFNPAASGKNIIVESARASFSSAQQYGIDFITAPGSNAVLSSPGIVPKKPGAVSVGISYKVDVAAFNGTSVAGLNSILTATLSANVVDSMKFTEPVILPPGYGLRIFGTVANTSLVGQIEYYEESV